MDNVVMHYGVKGMRWGVIRKSTNTKSTTNKTSSTTKSNVKTMTDDELKQKIARLELEKKYTDLAPKPVPTSSNKTKAFVSEVLEKSGKNIATQTATYVMGTTINKIFGAEVVNPKKGQKDK
ncbi:MAG: hypothetical protein R3Y53_02000 [Bacillota bacterium]